SLGFLLALLAGSEQARDILSVAAAQSCVGCGGQSEHIDNRRRQKSSTISDARASTGAGDKTEPAGATPPEDMVSALVLATEDNQTITVQRVSVTTTAKGRTWTGVVKETGESALLMWWKDGGITGTLGYRGRLYKITNTEGAVRAALENKQQPFAIRTRSAD